MDGTLDRELISLAVRYGNRSDDSVRPEELQPVFKILLQQRNTVRDPELLKRMNGIISLLDRKLQCGGIRILGVCGGTAGEVPTPPPPPPPPPRAPGT